MKEKINEEVLCVLKTNKLTNQIDVDYIKIETQFTETLGILSELCDDPQSTVDQLINFIKKRKELDHLTGGYNYCRSISSAYQQGLSVNNQYEIKKIIDSKEIMLYNQKYYRENNNAKNYDIQEEISSCKKEIKERYIFLIKVYSISKAYILCGEDKSIVAYSHRSSGWSNPLYKLTTNFSVQIRTNFGFGNSSYFFTSLRYKNIEITPFSEWIDYEYANFSDIIRYSRSHILDNKYWVEAMEFSRDACNLSLTDETKFVEKYVIDECEKMVIGLEEIFTKEQFAFKRRESNERRIVDKKGHDLIKYRGEKISGALDFISKIIAFENIITIKSFINRIENCNKKIQPILVNELENLKSEISNLTEEINFLKPEYENVIQKNDDYINKRKELKELMMVTDENIGNWELEIEFQKKYSTYKEFKEEYEIVTGKFSMISMQIKNLTQGYDKINDFNDKIIAYFG
jgi:hypothetical protein